MSGGVVRSCGKHTCIIDFTCCSVVVCACWCVYGYACELMCNYYFSVNMREIKSFYVCVRSLVV